MYCVGLMEKIMRIDAPHFPDGQELTFYNYKEPLLAVPASQGFGYYGVLLGSSDGKFVQCHICGKLCRDAGRHAQGAHKVYATEYKERFQLARQTALCSEQMRSEKRDTFMKWLSAKSEGEQEAINKRALDALMLAHQISKEKGISTKGVSHRLETANKRGACPDQLLEKIEEVHKKLGHTPSKAEFITEVGSRYWDLILKVFGTWNTALAKLDLIPQTSARKNGYRHYTNEQLLEYLRVFTNANGRPPTYTDFLRRLMPDYLTYQRRFGGIEAARQLAGVSVAN